MASLLQRAQTMLPARSAEEVGGFGICPARERSDWTIAWDVFVSLGVTASFLFRRGGASGRRLDASDCLRCSCPPCPSNTPDV